MRPLAGTQPTAVRGAAAGTGPDHAGVGHQQLFQAREVADGHLVDAHRVAQQHRQRGLQVREQGVELERLVDSGDYAVAFSMFPVTVDDLLASAGDDGVVILWEGGERLATLLGLPEGDLSTLEAGR